MTVVVNSSTSGGGNNSFSSTSDLYNTPTVTNSLRTSLMQAATGAGRLKVAVIGDSTTVNSFGLYKDSWISRLVKLMSNAPETVPLGASYAGWQDNSFFGNQNFSGTPANYQTYDPRVVFGSANWVNTQACDPCGYQFTYNGAGGFNNSAATLSFTPANSIDSFTIWHGGRSGTYTVNVDGGAALTVASGQSAGLSTVSPPSSIASFSAGFSTFTVTPGVHTINIVIQSGTTTDIRGINAWTSTASYVDIWHMASSGATTAQVNTSNNFFDGGKWWAFNYSPDITIVRLTTNELAAYIAGGNLQSYITSYLSRLDVIYANRNSKQLVFVAGPWYGPAATTISSTGSIYDNALLAALVGWCKTNSVPFFDFFSQWGLGTSAGATNLIGGDSTHPTTAGQHAEAMAWKSKLISIMNT